MLRLLALSLALLVLLSACGGAGGEALPADGEQISWERAVELLYAGEVVSVLQLHSREVRMGLSNGAMVTTIAPELDLVFDVMMECGAPCADIMVAME